MRYEINKRFAIRLDESDPLKKYRQLFYFPAGSNRKECIYFCGNSLGLQPKSARAVIEQVLADWANLGVDGHFQASTPWVDYPELLVLPTAQLIGANPIEVALMNTLTVNLHLMLVSFYNPIPTRNKIIIESRAFPSDVYAVKSHIKYHGFDPKTTLLEFVPRVGEDTIRTEDIESFVEKEGDSIALILLGGVNYYTGQAFELDKITRAAHNKGCLLGFDLAHAIGNIELKLHQWDVDFAVWCSYKYLNAGPGSLAGCFVHERFANRVDLPRLAGWWGHNEQSRFTMPAEFDPTPGAQGWQVSNPPILAMVPLRASMELFDEVGMGSLRIKSQNLTGYLEFLCEQLLPDDIRIITPRNKNHRGCQLSFMVKKNGRTLFEKLKAKDIICDWREPDVMRVAPVPLYNSYLDVFQFVQILKKELETTY